MKKSSKIYKPILIVPTPNVHMIKQQRGKKMILDYSKYIEDYSWDHPIDGRIHRRDENFLFRGEGFCPFCNIKAKLVVEHNTLNKPYSEERQKLNVWACDCGWWEIKDLFFDKCDNRWGFMAGVETASYKHGILKSFAPEDIEIPIKVLRNEIKKNPKILYKIHPHNMEKVVQSVLSEYYDCEVEHCGKSHDGGIDLFVLHSDSPVAVQVKRRQEGKTESVSAIRDFLGAMMLKGVKTGIFLTTADHFSLESQKAAKKSITMDLVNKYELIDFEYFIEIFNLVQKKPYEPWKKYIECY
jgi:hypothetical protein